MDFTEARDSEWQWHQPDHMQISTLQRKRLVGWGLMTLLTQFRSHRAQRERKTTALVRSARFHTRMVCFIGKELRVRTIHKKLDHTDSVIYVTWTG